MALSISQLVAVSYPLVLAENRKPSNQWSESSFMQQLEKAGAIVHKSLGATIEAPLDYQRNPGTVIQAVELQALSMTKTEVITSASYDIAEVTAPILWSKKDEATNSAENQKVALVASLITNAIDSHDDILEQQIFATSTNGFLGLKTHALSTGLGSDGGIDASTFTFWRNQQATYVDDTDIEATFTTVFNACSKGSGAKLKPTLMVSDAATNALFEGTQQALQRYDSQDLKAGFKSIMFKTATYVFSQYGDTNVYFLNPKNFNLVVSKEFWRDRDDTQVLENANGYVSKVYSAVQTVTNNRSRLGVAHL